MEDFKEFQGKSLDEAIKGACSYFDAPREKLEIDIVQDAKNGIFGLVGARKAVVRARRAQLKSKVGALLGREAVPSPQPKLESVRSTRSTRAASPVSPASPASSVKSGEQATETPDSKHPPRSPRPERETHDRRRPPRDFGQPSILPRPDRSQEEDPSEDESIGNRIVPLPEFEDESFGNRIIPPPEDEDESIGNRFNDPRGSYPRSGGARPFSEEQRRPRQEPRPKLVPRPVAPRPERARAEAPSPEFTPRPDFKPRPEFTPRPDFKPRQDFKPRPEFPPLDVENREIGFEPDESFVEGFTGTPFSELDHEKLAAVAQNVATMMVHSILGETPMEVKILENRVDVRVECGDDSGLLIGREGQTLAALQYLASRLVSRTMEASVRIQFDVGDYRERQDDRLRELALALAERVRATGRPCSTRPMSSYHRRLVHMALQDAPDMQTRSSGEGPLKRVIIQRRRQFEK